MTPKSKKHNSSMSRGIAESIGMGHTEYRGEAHGWSCDGCHDPTCRVCAPQFCREDLAISPTYILVHSLADARLNDHLDAALRLMRNAALIFRDTAYNLEELVHTIEAARREASR